MQLSNFLRAVLKLDAATCLGTGALALATAGYLSGPLGIETGALSAAAVSLIPIGLFILWLGTRREAHPALVYLVIVGNLGWTAASFATVFGLPGITAMGVALVAAQGLVVLVLALLEWRGLVQSREATWAA